MDFMSRYDLWIKNAYEDPDLLQELTELNPLTQSDEIARRFSRELTFGTGGLRGIIGAGTNRMNIYVVRQATQGLCNYLKKQLAPPYSVAIAYDSRRKSTLFAAEAARVLAANGIIAWIYPRLEPTPALSWAVRYLKCSAGICITASHNPSNYNGYKVYGSDGCQITLAAANAIVHEISITDIFLNGMSLPTEAQARALGLIRSIPEDCLQGFLDEVQRLRINPMDFSDLNVVYTPLNGTGTECIERILHKNAIGSFTIVPEQKQPDGSFPTCPRPNPEEAEALAFGLALCKKIRPDLLIGTDPDCDRMGAAVPGDDGFTLISGNEMGVLLLDYICRSRILNHTMPQYPVAVTTIVSTDMVQPIADYYGVELRHVLTGFKYIGEQIGLLEAAGQENRFIFGFEESYGYLSGTHVRDKDAVNASLLCCEMAAWYKKQGMTLYDALQQLYQKYGYYACHLTSFTFDSLDGMEKMQSIMHTIRHTPPSALLGETVISCLDYMADTSSIFPLPRSDVLEFRTEHFKLLIRPSGTEPKLKVYLSSRASDMHTATAQNQMLLDEIEAGYLA